MKIIKILLLIIFIKLLLDSKSSYDYYFLISYLFIYLLLRDVVIKNNNKKIETFVPQGFKNTLARIANFLRIDVTNTDFDADDALTTYFVLGFTGYQIYQKVFGDDIYTELKRMMDLNSLSNFKGNLNTSRNFNRSYLDPYNSPYRL